MGTRFLLKCHWHIVNEFERSVIANPAAAAINASAQRACHERNDWRQARPLQEGRALGRSRSEEHTSELQSLMRISYAVFCLKKKNIPHQASNNNQKRYPK